MSKHFIVVVDRLEVQHDGVRNDTWDQLMTNVEVLVDRDGLSQMMESPRVTVIHSIKEVVETKAIASTDEECLGFRNNHLDVVHGEERAAKAARLAIEAARLMAQARELRDQ